MARSKTGPLRTLLGRRRYDLRRKLDTALTLKLQIDEGSKDREPEQLVQDYGILVDIRRELLINLNLYLGINI